MIITPTNTLIGIPFRVHSLPAASRIYPIGLSRHDFKQWNTWGHAFERFLNPSSSRSCNMSLQNRDTVVAATKIIYRGRVSSSWSVTLFPCGKDMYHLMIDVQSMLVRHACTGWVFPNSLLLWMLWDQNQAKSSSGWLELMRIRDYFDCKYR